MLHCEIDYIYCKALHDCELFRLVNTVLPIEYIMLENKFNSSNAVNVIKNFDRNNGYF